MASRLDQIITNSKKAYNALYPKGIINHHYKVIYFPIPKVASSTVKRVLYQPGENQDPSVKIHQIEFPKIKVGDMPKYQDYTRFAIVRDPYARMVSCYKDKIIRWSQWKGKLYPGFLRYNQIMGLKLFNTEMSFIDFLKAINKLPNFLADEHIRSQYRFLPVKNNQLLLDELIKLENMEPIKHIFYDIPFDNLIQSNSTTSVKDEGYLTAEAKELIRKRYKKDFELLNYEL